MIRVFLSRFFCSAEEKGDRDRLHWELDAIQQKEERRLRKDFSVKLVKGVESRWGSC
jgi:predicted transposase YbfD/YdcC